MRVYGPSATLQKVKLKVNWVKRKRNGFPNFTSACGVNGSTSC